MKKTPAFLNFRNEKAAPGREFILSTRKPAFLAEVYSFNSEAEVVEFGQQFMQLCEDARAPCIGSRSRKPWKGKHYFFAAIEIYEPVEFTQPVVDKLAKVARRMADWYLYNILTN